MKPRGLGDLSHVFPTDLAKLVYTSATKRCKPGVVILKHEGGERDFSSWYKQNLVGSKPGPCSEPNEDKRGRKTEALEGI